MKKFEVGCAGWLALGRRAAIAMLALGILTIGLSNSAFAQADLEIVKSIIDGGNPVDSIRVRGGDPVQFSISVENSGPSAAQNLRIEDSLPAGFVADPTQTVFGDADWSCDIDASGTQDIYTCTYEQELAAEATAPALLLDVTTPAVADDYTNQAVAESDADTPGDFPWSSNEVDIEVYLEADLRIAKQASASSVLSGAALTYTYTISNQGPHPASSITLKDVFDRTDVLGSITLGAGADDWSCAAAASPPAGQSVLECDSSATLELGGSDQLVLEVEIIAPATNDVFVLGNMAEVNSAEDLPDPAANVSEQVEVEVVPAADLELLNQSLSSSTVDAGSLFNLELQIRNHGPSNAVDVQVDVPVPAGVQLQSAPPAWDCGLDPAGGQLRCRVEAIDAAVTETIEISLRAPRNPPEIGAREGQVSIGAATVESSIADPDPSNNSFFPSSLPLTVRAAWNLDIEKTVNQELLAPGLAFRYDIRVTNTGPSDLVLDSSGEDKLRPRLSDEFDPLLRADTSVCSPLSSAKPCWRCDWRRAPEHLQTLDNSTDPLLAGINGAWTLAASPDGRHVYTAGRFDNAVTGLSRRLNRSGTIPAFGTLDDADITVNPAPIRPRALALSPDGRRAVAATWLATGETAGDAELVLLSRTLSNGHLSVLNRVNLGGSASAIVFSVDGRFVYLADSAANAIRVYDLGDDDIVLVTTIHRDADNGILLDGVSDLALDPGGTWLYAAAPGDASLVAFELDPVTGIPSPLDVGGVGPAFAAMVGGTALEIQSVAVNPVADELVVGGQNSVVTFSLDAGIPSQVGEISAIPSFGVLMSGVVDLAWAPDGMQVFVVARDDARLVRLSRTTLADPLQFGRAAELGETDNGDALIPNALVIDPLGEQVYVSASTSAPSGLSEPDASALLTFNIMRDAQCAGLPGQILTSGDIDDRPLSLPAGQQLTVSAFARLSAAATVDELTNIAELIDADDDLLEGEQVSEVRVATDISVTQALVGQRLITGEALSIEITIANDGPLALNGLELDHQFNLFADSDPGFVPGTVGFTCSASGNACCISGGSSAQCGVSQPTAFSPGDLGGRLVDIAAGGSLTFTAGGRLHPSSEPGGEIVNEIGLIMPDGIESTNPDGLFSQLSAPVQAEGDVWIEKRSERLETVESGNGEWPESVELVAIYRLRVGNRGPSAVMGARLIDDLLADDALLEDQARWSCSIETPGDTLSETCCFYSDAGAETICETTAEGLDQAIDQLLALAPGSRLSFELAVPVDEALSADGTITNEAELRLPAGFTATDPSALEARLTRRLAATAELNVTKQLIGTQPFVPGEEIGFQIVVTNDGPDGVPVRVEDILPDSIENVVWECDASTPIPGDLIYNNSVNRAELFNTRDVIASFDGRHVYISGAGGEFGDEDDADIPGAIAVFERNIVPGPNFGELTLLEVEIDGVNDESDSGQEVEGLTGAGRMALSPDERHLYVVAGSGIVVFRRENVPGSSNFGRLTFAEVRLNGSDQPADVVSPVTGLRGASDVVVSNDGEHVYVTGRADSAIAVFRRNVATGTLAFLGAVTGSDLAADDFDGLWGATHVAVAPDDRFVYAMGRGLESGFSGSDWTTSEEFSEPGDPAYFVGNTPGIALKWLTQEQPLTVVGDVEELALEFDHLHSFDWPNSCYDVGVLEISLDGGDSWADVLDFGASFADPVTGYNGTQNGFEDNPLLNRQGWCENSPGWPMGEFTSVRVEFGDTVVGGDEISVRFGLGEGSAVGEVGWWIKNIRFVDADDDSNVLYADQVASDNGGGNIMVFSRATDSTEVGFGLLEPIADYAIEQGLDAAAMDATAASLYVGSAADQSIEFFTRDAASGLLQSAALYDSLDALEGANPEALEGLAALAVSPDGEHLMASGAISNELVVFRRQPLDGTLAPLQVLRRGDRWPEIDEDLELDGGVDGVRGIHFSSDGLSVFTAAQTSQLGYFDRVAPDPNFGFLEAVFDQQNDGFGNEADGLLGARALALSNNGRWLFVASFGQLAEQSGFLTVLERDAVSTEPGQHLRYRQTLANNQADVKGLNGAADVLAIGRDIYVVSERDNALARFRQENPDGVSGQVEFKEAFFNNVDAQGLLGAAGLAATPSGSHVYVASRFDHSVVIFRRDSEDGTLSFQGRVSEGVDGVSGLLGANALTASADGQHLYVASRQSDAVVVFDIDGDELVHRQTFFDGTEGAILTSPTSLALSRDGQHLMVSSLDGNAVTVLRRQTDSTVSALFGRVRFHSVLVDGVGGVESLRGPRDLVVDPDDDRVYVVSELDNALVVLERNTSAGGQAFGNLNQVEVRREGTGSVIGLQTPYGVAVSSGARRNLYTASLGSQSVAAFVRRSGSSCPLSGSGNLNEDVFIAAEGTVRFFITGTIRPGASGQIVNTARISWPEDVENTSGNPPESEVTTDSLVPFSELTVSKTNNRLAVTAGEPQRYQIVVDNAGPSTAMGVDISDILSPDDFLVSTAAWSCRAVGAGLLDPRETLSQPDNEISSLLGLSSLAWSPAADPALSERVYATGVIANALTVLEIDEVSGELRFDGAISQAIGVSGLRGARAVVVSATGRYVYVTSQVDNRILVFEVDTVDAASETFGDLVEIQQLGPSDGDLSGLNQPVDAVLSPDGLTLYVAAANSSAIYVFRVSDDNGQLSLLEIVERTSQNGLGGVSRLLLSPAGESGEGFLYAAGPNDSAVSVFSRDGDGRLTHEQTRSSPGTPGLTGVSGLAMDTAGANLYAVGRDDNAIVVFNRINNPDNAQFGRLASAIEQRLDASNLSVIVNPRDIVVSPDGGSVYVATFGNNSLLAFGRDRENGRLEFLTRYQSSPERADLAGISSLAFDGDGENLFVGALIDSAVTRFERGAPSRCGLDTGSGNVELDADVAAGGSVIIELQVHINPNSQGSSCPAALDPDRQCVINTVEIDHDQDEQPEPGEDNPWTASDASFLERSANLVVNKTDGLAEFRGLKEANAVAATSVVESHLYVAAPGEPGLGVYAISPDSGPTGDYPLTFIQYVLNGQGGVSQLNGISDVQVSSDGQHVYASSRLDSAIVAFSRDADSGKLEVLAIYSNNAGGVSGMSGATSMVLSDDGKHLYVAGRNSNAIVVFSRNSDDTSSDFGRLSFVQSLQDGTDDVQDLRTPRHLALSGDGRHLYAAASQSDAVVVFRRVNDAQADDFGKLTWIQSRRNLSGGVSGLLDVSRVRVSNDGQAVYAAGTGNNSVVWFDREASSSSAGHGRLTFGGRVTEGEDGALGLTGISDLVLLGAGQGWLAATSPESDSVALYRRDPDSQALTFQDWLVDDASTGSGLSAARALASLPGEDRLFVAASAPGSLSVVSIDQDQLRFDGAVVQGQGGAVPGEAVTYTITVRNDGPSRVAGARFVDQFPTAFESVIWDCQFDSPQSACPAQGGQGNIDVSIDVAAGDTVTFIATGILRQNVSGFVVNEAFVELPAGVLDRDPASNSAIDDDTIVSAVSDLAMTIEDLPASVQAGDVIDYRLRVRNLGSSSAAVAHVTHVPPEALSITDWSCEADREPGNLVLLDPPPQTLNAFTTTVVSSDGRHLYALGSNSAGDGALVVFGRDSLSGSLTDRQQITNLQTQTRDGETVTVDGLAGARDVLISPDGAHLYVAGFDDDAVAVFERDPVNGRLFFLQVVRDNIGPVDGLGGPNALAMPASGAQLYVSGSLDDAVVVFDRDPASGKLEFVQVRRSGVAGVTALVAPSDLVLTDDDESLLVAARGSDAVVRFGRATNGLLDTGFSFSEGRVIDDGADSYLIEGLVGVRSLAVSADGRWLYTLARSADNHALVRFERLGNQVMRPVLQISDGDQIGQPPVPVEGLATADSLVLTDQDRQLYLAGQDLGEPTRQIVALGSADQAELQFLGRFAGRSAPGNEHISRISTTPDGRHLYGSGLEGPDIDVFALLDGSRCTRTGQGVIFDRVSLEAGGELVYDIQARIGAIARGDFLAEASVLPGAGIIDPEFDNNTDVVGGEIVAAAGLEVTKTLTTDPVVAGEPVTWTIDITNAGPSTIRGIAVVDDLPTLPGNVINPGGPGVVAGSGEWLCESTPQLEVNQSLDALAMGAESSVRESGDGRWVAATGGDTVTLYSRDPVNGWLTVIASVSEGDELFDEDDEVIGEVSGLGGASDLLFSPDAEFLYVAAAESNAISWFAINQDESSLDFLGALNHNASAGVFLERPLRLLPADSGERIFVAARGSSAVTTLSLDSVTGQPSWLDTRRSGVGLPLNVLDGVRDLALSPDGRFLYAAAASHNGIAIFETSSSGLQYSARIRNATVAGGPNVVGLGLVQSIAISEQGNFLYAASLAEDSVTVFTRDPDSGALTMALHYKDGFAGLSGLDGANSVALSPDGQHLYVGAINDGQVSVFDRDWATGGLDRIETLPLAGIRRIVPTASGGQLLAVSSQGTGALKNVHRGAHAYCGIDSVASDSLLDSIDLAAGGSLRYTVTALVHPGARGELENLAMVELPPLVTATTPGDHQHAAVRDIQVITDLSIEKSIDSGVSSLVAGNEVRFVLSVRNFGPSHAFDAEVIDTLPEQLLNPAWTCQPDTAGSSCTGSGAGNIAELVDLALDDRLLYLVDGTIAPNFRGTLENIAEVVAPLDANDPDTGNNVSSAAGSVSGVADVSVSKTTSESHARPGETVTFEIEVANVGPSDVAGVAIIDALPDGLLPIGWSCVASGPTPCPADNAFGELDLVTPLASGSTLSFQVEVQVDPSWVPGVLTNVASAQLLGTATGDPDLSNNSDAAQIEIIEPRADVMVTKTVDLGQALPGDLIAYEIIVSNDGPSTASELSIIDLMPAELINVTWTCRPDGVVACPVNSGTGDLQIELDLLPGNALVFEVEAQIDPATEAGPDRFVINTVTATSPVEDPDPDNNQDSAVTMLDMDRVFSDRFEPIEQVSPEEDE